MFARTISRRPQPSPSPGPSFASQRPIQPKLTVGPVDDPFEREADRVAERVVSRLPAGSLLPAPLSPATVQRQEAMEDPEKKRDEKEGEVVRLKAAAPPPAAGAPSVAPAVEAGIRGAAGGGRPLPEPVRGAMETAFGTDFKLVRVHADNRSDRLNRSLGARAFTTGTDVFFRGGEFQPHSTLGRHLIAHELTHVVQQGRRGAEGGRFIQRDPCYVSGVQGPYEGAVNERNVAIAPDTLYNADQRRDILTENNNALGNVNIQLNNTRSYTSDENDDPLVTKDSLTHHLAEIDHIYPEARGGGNSVRNAQVLSQYENGQVKRNTYPWTNTRTLQLYSGARVLLPEGRLAWGVAARGVLDVIGHGANANVRLPAGSSIPQGGVLYAIGRTLAANTMLRTWMRLPANFPIETPAGSQLPFFVRLGAGFQLPADLTLPDGFVPTENIVLPLNTVHQRTFTPIGPFGFAGPPQTVTTPVGGQALLVGQALNGSVTLPAGQQLPSLLTLPAQFVTPFDTSIQLSGAASPAVDFALQNNVQLGAPVTFAQTTPNLGADFDLELAAARANGLAPAAYDPT
jgi:hypothetical protein